MNTQEALNLLNSVAEAFTGNRADHMKLQAAVEVIQNLINEKTAKKTKD